MGMLVLMHHDQRPSRLPWGGLTLLVLTGVIVLAAGPVRHIRLEEAVEDNATLLSFYQALADEVNSSLTYPIQEDFEEALRTLGDYRSLVLQLTLFRQDLASRSIDALILGTPYDTDPWAGLGRRSQSVIESQQELRQTIDRAYNASRRGDQAQLWIQVITAQAEVQVFNSTITELTTGIQSLPPYIDVRDLERRLLDLWGIWAMYGDMIAQLVRQVPVTFALSLETDRTSVYLGEDLKATGSLMAGSHPIPGIRIAIRNGNQTLAENITTATGSYQATIHIPLTHPAGEMTIRAEADLFGTRVASRGKTIVVERIPTTTTLSTPSPTLPTSSKITLHGVLLDHKARGLDGAQITLHTQDTQDTQDAQDTRSTQESEIKNWSTTTETGGTFRFESQAPPIEATISYMARFNGSPIHQPSESQWVTIRTSSGEAETETPTRLLLDSNTSSVNLGGAIRFHGNLSTIHGKALAHRSITLNFLGQGIPTITDSAGAYGIDLRIPETALPGTYPAQSFYQPAQGSNETASSSNIVLITIPPDKTHPGLNQTVLDLQAVPSLIMAGQDVQFQGTLQTIGGLPIPEAEILIRFLDTTRDTTTRIDGAFALIWPTNPQTGSGTYPAQAFFTPLPETNLSAARSNLAYVTILAGEKLPDRLHTNIEIAASTYTAAPGQEVTISGTLYDDWGNGIPARPIMLESPNFTATTHLNTSQQGTYSQTTAMPGAEGVFQVRSAFPGDARYLPAHSSLLTVNISQEHGEKALGTQLTISVPDKARSGATMSIWGMLCDETGRTLDDKEVTVRWDGQDEWNAATNASGIYLCTVQVPEEPGEHTVQAIFSSDDERYSSCQSAAKTVLVWMPTASVYLTVLILSAIPLVALALAFARGTRLRTRSMGPSDARPAMRTASEEIQRTAQPAPSPGVDGEPIERSLQAPGAQPLFSERDRALRAYDGLVELAARSLSMNLSSKTHTQILYLLLAVLGSPSLRDGAALVTDLYEKAAYSASMPGPGELEQYYALLETLGRALEPGAMG